ncbi:transcriptional regulator [Alteromonas aestuariivivens]|uniref:Anti-sigma-E factor RseA n=1 Tax=Alteromonas aestuariivivens TaxID=1938339 RepID=A0A3D8MET1_9ALTE|nr:RseA family anti-sigma factor [Alteromonas aestuariivivens]RDV29335.1 transcriptional regulator [Alteromonas aestuariivivens]
MTQQQEKLSAFMDGETDGSDIIDAIKEDALLKAKWHRYHVIRNGLRGEASVLPELDITASVAAALADEPTVMAPRKSGWKAVPVVSNIVPFFKQSGQFAMAASVAAAVILGVQQYNHQPTPEEPFLTAPTVVGPQGGLAPVSLEQTRALPRNDMALLLEKKRKINALIADHEQQVQLKQAEEQSAAAEEHQQQDQPK